MESTTHEKSHQSGGGSHLGRDLNSATDQLSDAAAEKLGQAKQKVGEIYDQVNKTVNDQYSKAVDYSRDNPGKTTLIAFGVGVGVGLLIVGNIRSSHRSRSRVVAPVVHALSTLANDLFA